MLDVQRSVSMGAGSILEDCEIGAAPDPSPIRRQVVAIEVSRAIRDAGEGVRWPSCGTMSWSRTVLTTQVSAQARVAFEIPRGGLL